MSEPHCIRLRGPWEVEGSKRARKFGRPQRSNARERVWLFIDALKGNGTVTLNGEPIQAENGELRLDATERLNGRNLLVLCDWDEVGNVMLLIDS